MRLRPPSSTYKVAFLIGGFLFAVITYVIGTIIYQIELKVFDGSTTSFPPLLSLLSDIWQRHLLTFTPWVVGTTLLSIALGYLYDRQRELRHIAEAMAVTDSLTLLYNHRYLMQQLTLEIERSRRALAEQFAVLMIDIDDFKDYNDSHGHLAGDQELRRVATAIKHASRETDLVARYGGEEVVVVAPGTGKAGGAELAERIRLRVKHSSAVTVSIGVAAYPEDGRDVDGLIHAADQAMYTAKRQSKDQVVLAGETQ